MLCDPGKKRRVATEARKKIFKNFSETEKELRVSMAKKRRVATEARKKIFKNYSETEKELRVSVAKKRKVATEARKKRFKNFSEAEKELRVSMAKKEGLPRRHGKKDPVFPWLKKEEMKFSLEKSFEILEKTPAVLSTLLGNLSEEWIMNNEGPETFSPYDVLGHLLHGEETDWAARAKLILEQGTSVSFIPWDRFAMYEESRGKNLQQLLDEFEKARKENLRWLKSLNLTAADLDKKGMHPTLGEVSLRNLLSTWVVHDLTHLAQISRVMAKQYKDEMGPWTGFFRILNF